MHTDNIDGFLNCMFHNTISNNWNFSFPILNTVHFCTCHCREPVDSENDSRLARDFAINSYDLWRFSFFYKFDKNKKKWTCNCYVFFMTWPGEPESRNMRNMYRIHNLELDPELPRKRKEIVQRK